MKKIYSLYEIRLPNFYSYKEPNVPTYSGALIY